MNQPETTANGKTLWRLTTLVLAAGMAILIFWKTPDLISTKTYSGENGTGMDRSLNVPILSCVTFLVVLFLVMRKLWKRG